MRKLISKKDYRKLKGINLENKAKGMKVGIFSADTVFKAVPFTEDEMEATILDYADKRTRWELGGIAQRHDYDIAIIALLHRMDTLAEYVDDMADDNTTIFKMANLEVSYDPDKDYTNDEIIMVEGITLDRVGKGINQLVSDCNTYPRYTNLIAILSEGSPLPEGTEIDSEGCVLFPQNRGINIRINISLQGKKYFRNLKLGVTYYVYYVAVTTNSISRLSVGVSELCG